LVLIFDVTAIGDPIEGDLDSNYNWLFMTSPKVRKRRPTLRSKVSLTSEGEETSPKYCPTCKAVEAVMVSKLLTAVSWMAHMPPDPPYAF